MARAAAPDRNQAPDQLLQAAKQVPLQRSLDKNLAALQEFLRDCSDLVMHEVVPRRGYRCFVLYMDGLVKKDLVDRDIIGPLQQSRLLPDVDRMAAGLTAMGGTKRLTNIGEVVEQVLAGSAAVLVEGAAEAVGYGVQGWEGRAVSEPSTEAVIRGPRESFVETLRTNTALIRRKIRSPALKMVSLTVGRITQTSVVVAYLEGIADAGVVQEVLTRIRRIDIDGVLEGGYVEEFIQDSPMSPFPTVQNSERPDTVAGQLLEGRVAILVDGTPFVLIVPALFVQLIQSSEDYYERFLVGSAIRMLRYVFLGIALLLPSLYIAIITFHQEMLPSGLLLSVAAAREGVPFPALVEALLMEVAFEVLREGGLRLPRPVGQAVSIVGALVIGDAAVRAGLVSAPMIIVVALTGIASFTIPRYNASIAIRMLRFPLMFLAGSLGMFGIMAGLTALLLHLSALRSFGVPYLTPLAPLDWQGVKDVIIRAPRWWARFRPQGIGSSDPVRTGAALRPGPNQGRPR